MKKIIAFSLTLIMLFAFCGCSKKQVNSDNIIGTWESKITVKDFSLFTGLKIIDRDSALPSQYIEKMKNIKVQLSVTYNENGKCDKKVLKKDVDKLYDEFLNIVMDFYKEIGMLMDYQAYSSNINTIDDLKEYLLSKDTTLENVLEEYKTKVKEALKNEKVKMGFTKADKNWYYVLNEKPEKYSVKDNKIEIVNENKITSYCELTNKNTIKINKINDNEILHEVSITFKRKELQKR